MITQNFDKMLKKMKTSAILWNQKQAVKGKEFSSLLRHRM